jgi:hypothetical protein
MGGEIGAMDDGVNEHTASAAVINRGGRFIESTSKMAVGRNGMHREWRKRGKGAFGLYDIQTSSSPSSRLMTKTAHFLS